MALTLYYDDNTSLDPLKNKKIAVMGYGSQGHAHALNLKDSGLTVAVGLPTPSKSRERAEKAGLTVKETKAAAEWADVMMMLIPDEHQRTVYEEQIRSGLKPGKALAFAHGFNIHFKNIVPPAEVDVFMVAPKGPGHTVRREYTRGSGVPCLIAIHQNPTGTAKTLALSYAKGLGGTRAGVIETNFREETETDLFGEQAVLCGGLSHLIKAGFETLVEAGYDPVMAYFECLHEMKLIVDLVYEGGIANMRFSISNTAEYGDYISGPRVIDDHVKANMKKILAEVQSGEFAKRWIGEVQSGSKQFNKFREDNKHHLIEKIGAELRSKIKFPLKERLVSADEKS